MSSEVALTGLEYIDKDGTRVSVEQNEEVDDIPKEILDDFREKGAIGSPVITQAKADQEKEDLLNKIDELQRQLAETKKSADPQQNVTPAKKAAAPQGGK
jgi:cell division septum initiation protein DivIVA